MALVFPSDGYSRKWLILYTLFAAAANDMGVVVNF